MPRCPQCGAELSADNPEGLCPTCLIQSALGGSSRHEFGTETDIPPIPVHPDQDFGRYRVIKAVGEGGMGMVYLARRDDGQFDQRVALKLVRHGLHLDSRIVRRFRDERQILATLNHPSIAAIYGLEEAAGTQALVLELVPATPPSVTPSASD